MKFTTKDLRLFKRMVNYSSPDDKKELSRNLHRNQPYFCNIIDPTACDPRCSKVYQFCTLFCSIASEHIELILNERYEEYTKIPEEYFGTVAHLIAQENTNIGNRGITYPGRIKKHIVNSLGFDNSDTQWLLIMIPAFLYTIEAFFSKENPEYYFEGLCNQL